MDLNEEQLGWLKSKRVDIPSEEFRAKAKDFDEKYLETKNRFKDLCSGKRVLIVGNSNNMILNPHRDEVDSYDVVVRTSCPPLGPKYYEFLGTKTTLWALCDNSFQLLSESEDFFKSDFFGYTYGRGRVNPHVALTSKVKGKIFLIETPESRIKAILRTRIPVPSTGMATINFFVDEVTSKQSLSLIGFDFFKCEGKGKEDKGKSFYEYKIHGGGAGPHNGTIEKERAEDLQRSGRLRLLEF